MNEQYFTELNGYFVKDGKAIHTYNSVAAMKSDSNLKVGTHVKTKGYYSINDGGNAEYYIVSEVSENDYKENLENGLYAKLIIDKEINVLQLGAKPDGLTDNTSIFQNGLNLAYQLNKPLFIPTGKSNRYLLENSLTIDLDNDSDAITIHGDLYNTNYQGTWTRFTSIICHSDFIVGTPNKSVNLTMYNLSIGFQDTTLENPNYNLLSVFKDINFTPLKLRHCYFTSVGYFMYNASYGYVSEIYDNTFYGINKAWIKTYSDNTTTLSSKHFLSDSLCHNNYIHGNRHTNPTLIDGLCDDDNRIENNYIDFFKFLFTCEIPNVIIATFGILSKNIFSRCFRITNRVISSTFIENNFQGWTREIINQDFDNQDTFMQNAKVGAFISDPVDLTYDPNYKEEYRNTKLINNKLYGIDYFIWLSGTSSTSSSFMKNFYEKGTIAIGDSESDSFGNKINDKYFYVKAISLSSMIIDFNIHIETLNYIDLSSDFPTAPNNAVSNITYNGQTYNYFIARNNQYVWLGDGLYIGKFDSSASSWDRFKLIKICNISNTNI